MSNRASSIVWAARIEPPTTKLVLLALADWCDDDGGRLFPSMRKIAERCSVGRCQTQRIVRGLIEQKLLSVVANQHGGKPGSTPHYRLHLNRIAALTPVDTSVPKTDSADATGRMDATGSADAEDGSHGCTGRVAPVRQTDSAGATQTLTNHQRTTREPERRARGSRALADASDMLPEVTEQALADWLSVRRAKRVGPLTETAVKGLKREASKAGLTLQQAVELCAERAWASLRADWLSGSRNDRDPTVALMTQQARRLDSQPAEGIFDVEARVIAP